MSKRAVRAARVNVRANVRTTPGPCSMWKDEDADFGRETLDQVGDKWSVLIIDTLSDGPTRYSHLADASPAFRSAC